MFRLNMFVWIVAVVSVLAISGTVDGRAFPNAFPRQTRQTTESIILDEQVPPTPKVLFYDQLVTHFDSSDARTFKNKYLIYDGFWDGKETSPMFFYCGNEGVIMDFYNNTGLMFDIGPQFNARIVFVEHRYYGDSMPFGADSLSSKETLQYLTVEEVLEDFTAIIKELKTDYPNQPVISFGGSYGGMLSAWYRLKYPQVIDGAISASAPVLQYEGYTNPENFSRVCTQDFAGADPACPGEILDGFAQILEDGATADGRAQLSSDFMLCNALRNTADVDQLVAFVTAGMYN
jgi:hypothetical protein